MTTPQAHLLSPQGQLWLRNLWVVLPPLPGLSPQQLAPLLTPEPQADGAPDTPRRRLHLASRRLTGRQAGMPGRPFVWLFSLKEAGFQGDAHRVCLGLHPAHPVADMQADGGVAQTQTQRDGPQPLPLRGWVWVSSTIRGNLTPLGYRASRWQRLPESSEHWGCLIRSLTALSYPCPHR